MPTPPPPKPEPGTGPIGQPGQPVRAIAFSSGGYDTVMQLGVIHALLVIQGKAPEAVVGVSAGAVNAAALAEVFQAAPGPEDWPGLDPAGVEQMLRERQRARVLRLRKILEAYLTAPSELTRSFFPDTLQVDAQQPLRPLELPIHDQLERDGRQRELQARQGLINLVNDLLGLRLSFATITRIARRYLGLRAAGEIRSSFGSWVARAFEVARMWTLIAVNLPRAAWIAPRLAAPYFDERARKSEEGATAAAIIFKPRWVRALKGVLSHWSMVLLLLLMWTTVSVIVVGGPYFIQRLISGAFWLLAATTGIPGLSDAAAATDRFALEIIGGTYAGVMAVVAGGLVISGAWRQIADFNRVGSGAVLKEVGWEAVGFLALLAAFLVVPLGISVLISVVADGWRQGAAIGAGLQWAELAFWWLLAVSVAALIYAKTRKAEDSYTRRLLARYDLADGLLSSHPLKQILIRLFDPDYYGARQMDDVVDRALRDDYTPSRTKPKSKLVADYEDLSPKIALGLMVANLKTGELENVPPITKVVDGLLAATSVSPLFPPMPIVDKLFLDGANITTEATAGLLTLLRYRLNPKSTVVHMYGVSHLPFSDPALGPPTDRGDKPYLNLLDVTNRALQLQRFRDAALERRMTELYTRVIPPASAVFDTKAGDRFIRVWVAPVEPEAPLELNDRIAKCSGPVESRRLMSEAVADGCRAGLEVMIRDIEPAEDAVEIPCRRAVEVHLARTGHATDLPLLVNLDREPSKPAQRDAPPGLPEVCRHCTLRRNTKGEDRPAPNTLAFHEWKQVAPAWPHELEESPDPGEGKDPHFERKQPEFERKSIEALKGLQEEYWSNYQGDAPQQRWPRNRGELGPGDTRPMVSLLFSGGVFRGVYQLGTLSALSEAGLVPDVIAGASVGSITGAMVAQALAIPEGAERDGRLARLAATYLAMDRLVLTDRFADFIRGLTLRAAATRFSLSQADRFLRRYDQAGSGEFDEEARMVMAGLERLFWLSPFELKRLVKAVRLREWNKVYELLREYTQEWLDRMGVGNQVLGAEPLALLITEHVLQPLRGERFTSPELTGFDRYLTEAGIYFLATATNLTEGRLEILGEQQLQGKDRATLLEGLLASSAFPGVFRPRWSWEVMPASTARCQYIDGGVMDNLPLDAVGHFLRLASERDVEIVARSPVHGQGTDEVDVPHLLFSASLEIAPEEPTREQMDRFLNEWPLVMKRAKQLRYNKKLDLYAATQRAIRAIWEERGKKGSFVPLNLEVVMVKPRWLCGTFGFHPMLGFRRAKQAESIAHGCATALLELARVARKHPTWATGWGLDPGRLPADPPDTDKAKIVPGKAPPGHCWFRPGVECPFGEQRLRKTGLPERTTKELMTIHAACGRPETHSPR